MAIQDVAVDDLVTYFEDFDIDLLNALDDTLELKDVEIKARVRRLNHRPFSFSITVNSNQEQMTAVRIFLGPKSDWFGQEIPINEKRLYVIELDKFVAKGEGYVSLCPSAFPSPELLRRLGAVSVTISTLNVTGLNVLPFVGSATYETQN